MRPRPAYDLVERQPDDSQPDHSIDFGVPGIASGHHPTGRRRANDASRNKGSRSPSSARMLPRGYGIQIPGVPMQSEDHSVCSGFPREPLGNPASKPAVEESPVKKAQNDPFCPCENRFFREIRQHSVQDNRLAIKTVQLSLRPGSQSVNARTPSYPASVIDFAAPALSAASMFEGCSRTKLRTRPSIQIARPCSTHFRASLSFITLAENGRGLEIRAYCGLESGLSQLAPGLCADRAIIDYRRCRALHRRKGKS